MTTVVSITDFRNNISAYMDRVAYNNENFLLKKGNLIVATVQSYDQEKALKDKKKSLYALAGTWDKKTIQKFLEYKKMMADKSMEDYKKLKARYDNA